MSRSITMLLWKFEFRWTSVSKVVWFCNPSVRILAVSVDSSERKKNMFSFISQFLFERVEGISRATIIDLDAHQVSRYHYLSLCRCALMLRSGHWWQDNHPFTNPPINVAPCGPNWPLLSYSVECIWKNLHWQTAECIQALVILAEMPAACVDVFRNIH